MIEYLPRTEDPLITLLEDRSMYPSFKMSVIQELKARRMDAVQKMKKYSSLQDCRAVFWIDHFTKIQNEPCGQCDICKKNNLKPTIQSIQNQIFQLLTTEISVDDFSLNVPHQFKEDYFAVLNELIDRKKVCKTENNLLFLSA
jgi:superfamily II DNA helicase RecQ